MAISIGKIEKFLDAMDLNYQKKDENTILTGSGDDDGNRIMIVIQLQEDGEFLQLRTVKHLDDLVEEASEEKRTELLKWMLHQNYQTKNGTWEYDPTDHDHHMAIGHIIEDGDLTASQFQRMFMIIAKSMSSIPEMKKILGLVEEMDPVEKKRQELLAQLRELEGGAGI